MHFYEINDNKGFSLIELIIVIGILGILSTIALPSFFTVIEKTADEVVKSSLLLSFKECQIDIITGKETPTFQLDMGTVRRNGYYKFYQKYDYIPMKDGRIPSTILGNCMGPLGPHRLGVKKIKGKNKNGELWINLITGERTEKGKLQWN